MHRNTSTISDSSTIKTEFDNWIMFSFFVTILTGMVHAGMGHQQVESMLSTVCIPSMHHTTMKRMENELSSSVSAVAKDSCSAASKRRLMQHVY